MSEWNQIPGETPIDPSWIKIPGITTRSELDAAEAQNIRKVFLKYFSGNLNSRTAPFNFEWYLRLHSEMFGDVWEWAGRTRTENLNIGSPWEQVNSQLYALTDDVLSWDELGGPLDVQAVRLHVRAVDIHPFPGGNGRWARMLANIWLRLHGHEIVRWPTDVSNSQSAIRADYIEAVKLAIHDGNECSLIDIHRRHTASDTA